MICWSDNTILITGEVQAAIEEQRARAERAEVGACSLHSMPVIGRTKQLQTAGELTVVQELLRQRNLEVVQLQQDSCRKDEAL